MKPESPNAEILEAIGLLAENVQSISDNLESFKQSAQAEFNTIHEALHEFAGHVDKQFEGVHTEIRDIKERVQRVESDIGVIKIEMTEAKAELGQVKTDTQSIKSQMVTRDYLEGRLHPMESRIGR